MTYTVAMPPRFITDCIECDCDIGDWDGKRLTATRDQLNELRSRARHYATGGLDACESLGLIRSAQAVVKRLEALGL